MTALRLQIGWQQHQFNIVEPSVLCLAIKKAAIFINKSDKIINIDGQMASKIEPIKINEQKFVYEEIAH